MAGAPLATPPAAAAVVVRADTNPCPPFSRPAAPPPPGGAALPHARIRQGAAALELQQRPDAGSHHAMQPRIQGT
eukprot:351341-Chlamydomonas_euryale.AAC.5